jgi:nicotinamidase-related amidase
MLASCTPRWSTLGGSAYGKDVAMMWIRHPLPLLTQAVPAIQLDRAHTCLLLQDLHAPFADAAGGWLAARARAKVLLREFDEYFDALDLIAPNITRVLSAARGLGIQVVYSCLGYFSPGQPSAMQQAMGWEWNLDGPDGAFPSAWQPQPGEAVFAKPGWGALANPELVHYLRQHNISTVVVAGSMFEFGIRQSCGELADGGIAHLIVADGVAALTHVGRAYTGGSIAHGMTKLRSTGELLALFAELASREYVLV